MESEEGSTDAAIVAVATDSAPPNDSDVSPVGSPDHTSSEIQPMPSDDDPDQSAVTAGGLSEDLKQKIIKQARSPSLSPFSLFVCDMCIIGFKYV
ncbi:hypothetical protein M0R45_013585 [Rubus argutus]|uniref:Uncharacterized protein n=1 Tax=Rubus argutus TaxID=59490 RepID=A0AAW1XJV3_RUBAR